MTEIEKSSKPRHKIFDAIDNNDITLIKALITAEPRIINVLDENNINPLQHAAYKGNKEIVQLLLDHGANVRMCKHQHNYTALHFAALSGNSDICLALLMAGASTTETNSVGRTAAQMAAFVGHYDCVTIINNFVPISEVEYYSQTHGSDSKPYLPPFLVESFYKFILQINIHPVKVVINLYSIPRLQNHLPEVKKVLQLMCEREMKVGDRSNEVMAFKFHYLSYIVGEVIELEKNALSTNENDTETKKTVDVVAIFAKKLLKPSKDDELEFMDHVLKYCVKEFPFKECTLFKQIVTTITNEEGPSTLEVIVSLVNGKNNFVETVSTCATCGEEKPAKKCSKCRAMPYCNRECQKLHWPWHKKSCVAPSIQEQGKEITEN